MSRTLLQLEQAIIRRWTKLVKDDKVARVPVPSVTTAAGSTTTLNDRELGRGTTPANVYNGRAILFVEDVEAEYGTPVDLGAAISSLTATTITLDIDVSAIIRPGDVIVVNSAEKMLVTGVGTTTIIVTRGYAGSTAATASNGDNVTFAFFGAKSFVNTAGFDETSIATVSPALGAVVPTGINYLILPKGLYPEQLESAIADVLKSTESLTQFPLSLFILASDDNDMEASGVSAWTASSGNIAGSKDTDAVFNGSQSLAGTSIASGEYLYAAFRVHELISLYAGIVGRVASAGDEGILIAYDVTGAAEIDRATVDGVAWTELILPISVPSDCESLQIRLQNTGSDTIYWDDVQVWRNSDGIYPCPSYITHPEMIERIDAYPPGTGGPGTLDYRADEKKAIQLNWHAEQVDPRADVPVRIWVENPRGNRPYIILKREFTELTYLTQSSPIDEEYIVAKAISNLLKDSGDNRWRRYSRQAAKRARQINYGGRELDSQQSTVVV